MDVLIIVVCVSSVGHATRSLCSGPGAIGLKWEELENLAGASVLLLEST
jgi:hypothetical protein